MRLIHATYSKAARAHATTYMQSLQVTVVNET